MLRLNVQTERKYKEKSGRPENDADNPEDKEDHRNSDNETEKGSASNTDCDQDSDVSFLDDNEEEIDRMEIEEEDWVENVKRSTREAEEQMKTAEIPC